MSKRGFTLIELLIVVAIIAILAAIAVPNFLEAQMRAKVSRCKADMRSISIAIDSYVVDNNKPPHLAAKVGYKDDVGQLNRFGICCATNLTTPIAYLTTVAMADPFCASYVSTNYLGIIQPRGAGIEGDRPYTYYYVNIQGDAEGWSWDNKPAPIAKAKNHWSRYLLISLGPDYVKGPDQTGRAGNPTWYNGNYSDGVTGRLYNKWACQNYDPSNGSKSGGDILRWEGMGSQS
jgi:prepilin-type N-terminal cleavage/methylation domain-containing protein